MQVMVTDSKGNLYIGDWNSSRVQRFTHKGIGPVTTASQETLWPQR
jgi:hypothetical protein